METRGFSSAAARPPALFSKASTPNHHSSSFVSLSMAPLFLSPIILLYPSLDFSRKKSGSYSMGTLSQKPY